MIVDADDAEEASPHRQHADALQTNIAPDKQDERDAPAQPIESMASRERHGGSANQIDGCEPNGIFPVPIEELRRDEITAHYDHLGVQAGEIYNGADDNGSGTAALLALAAYFTEHRPRNSMIFLAVDAEEGGLTGARAFVSGPPVSLEHIVANVNMDMISHSDDELYVAGTYHYPFLKPYIDRIGEAAEVTLVFGHDSPDLGDNDWTHASDHAPFHEAGIPFLYFGVEDHADYHRPTDEFDRINQDFYIKAVTAILRVLLELDRDLEPVAEARRGR